MGSRKTGAYGLLRARREVEKGNVSSESCIIEKSAGLVCRGGGMKMLLGMKRIHVFLFILITSLYQFACAEASDNSLDLGTVYVIGESYNPADSTIMKKNPTDADIGKLLKLVPGANVLRNGPLSGIAQYRGMYGNRLRISFDDTSYFPSCPNHMDAPLSQVPGVFLKSLEVKRGIASVSDGTETIGGSIIVRTDEGQFGSGPDFDTTGNLDSGYSTANNSYYSGLRLNVANSVKKFDILLSREEGNDTEARQGKIEPTGYVEDFFGFGFDSKSSKHKTGIDYFHREGYNSGTPALPMDSVLARSDRLNLFHQSNNANSDSKLVVYWGNGTHRMDNYSIRPVANPAKLRVSDSEVKYSGYSISKRFYRKNRILRFGSDGEFEKHSTLINDPANAAFFINNFNDTSVQKLGFFAEQKLFFSNIYELEMGLRYNLVITDSDQINTSMAMAAAQTLVTNFNAADRSVRDGNIDWVIKLSREINNDLNLDIAAARKTRSPSYQERYLWMPLQSTAGLADGKNYVGDINLEPEVSNEVNIGLSWQKKDSYFNSQFFYRRVNNYIQGIPETDATVLAVSTMMGDTSPLKFANIESAIYGFDFGWGGKISGRWSADGILSYVRGKRKDAPGDLYRLPPLNGSVALKYVKNINTLLFEEEFASKQNKVAAPNNESPTAGYGVFNIRYNRKYSRAGTFSLGVENVFNNDYADHLNGLYRVTGGSIANGDRIPGKARNVYFSWDWSF